MNPKIFLTTGGILLIIMGVLGITGLLNAAFFYPPNWINWFHLGFGIVIFSIGLSGLTKLQAFFTLLGAIVATTIGLLGLFLGSWVASSFNIPKIADPSDHLAHLAIGLFAVWAWRGRKQLDTFTLNFSFLLRVIHGARGLAKHESWTRKEIKQYQDQELKKLREFAYANSPFYKQFHKGLENRPLNELPVLTKKQLMTSWDDVATDRSLHLKDVEQFLDNVKGLEAFKNKYYAFATGGTTGVKGITIYNKDEFGNFFSQSTRLSKWVGMHFKFGERPRMAVVQSHLPWHLAGAAGFIKLPIIRTLVLDTVEPLPQLVGKLNDFKPHVLGGYASNVHLLAQEQIEGRLNISPKTILTTAETLKKEARKAIKKAWGIEPYEAYGSTEIGEAAAECEKHNGLHIFDDLVILEVVDNDNKPVPAGTYGSKVLVTVLWNRTLPFIRYEISDHLKLSPEPCPCGRPFQLIQEIQGREEQVIYLSGESGEKVRIEPDIFFDSMVLLQIDGWQVVQESENAITFLILGPHPEFKEAEFLKKMRTIFVKHGARPPVLKVEYITELRRTKVGKLVTIQALPI